MTNQDWQTQARELLSHAIQAPSSHNTQPWLFRISAGAIDLFADRTRALPVNDPEDRELTISCGCALMNLRVAAAAEGLASLVRLEPDPDEPDLLASIRFSPMADASLDEAALAPAIGQRRTYRKRFAEQGVDQAIQERLVEAAQREGVQLKTIASDHDKRHLAKLVANGDAMQWADASWRRELAAWMHPRRKGDGLSLPALTVPVAQLVVRSFDMGDGVGARDEQLADNSPLLGVICTPRDNPHDWLQAGQALQRVLLTGCGLGLQASYLNQPVQTESLRVKLHDLLGSGFPQVLIRLGYPEQSIPPSPRRPLDDVLVQG